MSARELLIAVGIAAIFLPAYNLMRLCKNDAKGWRRLATVSVLAGFAELLLFIIWLLGEIIDGKFHTLFARMSVAPELMLAFLAVAGILNVAVYIKGSGGE